MKWNFYVLNKKYTDLKRPYLAQKKREIKILYLSFLKKIKGDTNWHDKHFKPFLSQEQISGCCLKKVAWQVAARL